MHSGFVGVHVGAGSHSEQKTSCYKSLCKVACIEATKLLKSGQTALVAVTKAVEILENSQYTNAGYGSNLTESGVIECDASVMDGESFQFGAVGAVSDVKNPIHFAKKLLDEQCMGLTSLNRIPPCFLAGSSAKEWALKNGIQMCSQDDLKSDGALKSYKHYKRKLMNSETPKPNNKVMRETLSQTKRKLDMPEEEVSDTVGAVVLDMNGNVAAASSSGGLVLKSPGRVGQAGVYGCGCWAQNQTTDQPISIATSTSGCGEYLIKTMFAKECATSMLSTDHGCSVVTLENNVRKKFLESPFLSNVGQKLVGVVVLRVDQANAFAEFLWSHTTNSMCIGYMSTNNPKPISRMSRLPEGVQPGSKIIVEGSSIKLIVPR